MFCFFLDSSGTPFAPSALLRRTTFPDQSGKAFKMSALPLGNLMIHERMRVPEPPLIPSVAFAPCGCSAEQERHIRSALRKGNFPLALGLICLFAYLFMYSRVFAVHK